MNERKKQIKRKKQEEINKKDISRKYVNKSEEKKKQTILKIYKERSKKRQKEIR